MMRVSVASLLVLLAWQSSRTAAFLSATRSIGTGSKSSHGHRTHRDPYRETRAGKCLRSSLSNEVFLLSYDGTVAKTTKWRISQGIDLAFSVWPHLKQLTVMTESDDDEWLRNKMKAVAHEMVSRPGVSMSCDYALLARLLIEEQEMDQGQSNGSSGKYGSKFHPQQEKLTSYPGARSRSSRPLTVGEIAENWNRGGCLAETLLVKYHIDFENPLPVLQDRIAELDETKYDIPEINEAIIDALEHSGGNIIVTVGHESDICMAQKTLSSRSERPLVVVSPDDGTLSNSLDITHGNDERLKLLAVSTTHSSLYRDVLRAAQEYSTVYIFESSWHSLSSAIPFFGDNIPRGGSGMAETVIGRGINLSLNFPEWKSSEGDRYKKGDVALRNEAQMNAWTNLVHERDFAELLSARIVRSAR